MIQHLIFQANKSFAVYIIAIFVNFAQCGGGQQIVTDNFQVNRQCEGKSVVYHQKNGEKIKEICSENQICQNGQCIDQEKSAMCPTPGNSCEGNTLVTCQENGERIETQCPNNETCSKGTCIGKEWVIDAGGSGEDNTHDVVVDDKGSVYYSGYLHGDLTFYDKYVASPSGYVAKVDKHGQHEWSIVLSSDDNFAGVWNIELAPDGSLYALGSFRGRINLQGTEYISSGYVDAFLLHVSKSGKILSFKQFKSKNEMSVKGLAIDKAGNVYITGLFHGSVEIDGQLKTGDDVDGMLAVGVNVMNAFVSKFSREGDIEWFRISGKMSLFNRSAKLVVTEKQDIFVSGFFTGNVRFEGQEVHSKGGTDVYLSKWDKDGNMEWLKSYGGPGAETNYSIATDEKGHVYLAGAFTGELNLGSKVLQSKNPETSDLLVTKWNEDGELIWAATAGGQGGRKDARDWEAAKKISVSKHGIFITGVFQKSIQLDDITLTSDTFSPQALNAAPPYSGYKRMENATECFVAQLNQDGKFIWATTPKGTSESWDRGMSLAHNENFLYIGGKYSGKRKMGDRVLEAEKQFLNLFVWKMRKPATHP